MAGKDNVRVLYRDGLILGADELMDDQTYFKAALERRSLARDTFGIAWGLDLVGAGGTLVVEPGVAYGGDGRAIVVRQQENISDRLQGARQGTYAVYLFFRETRDEGASAFRYCGQAQDPRVVEDYAFATESIQGTATYDRRPGARREPHADLQHAGTDAQSRVRLGIVSVDAAGQFTVVQNAARIPRVSTPDLSAEGAEYIGITAATITHPRRYSESVGQDATDVAIELDPESGIHARDPLVLHEPAFWEESSPVEHDFSLGLDALPAPHANERGLVWKALDPDPTLAPAIAEVPLLSGNTNRVGVHVPLEVQQPATFADDVDATAHLTVGGTASLQAVNAQGNVTVAGNLVVTGPANLGQATIDQLTITTLLTQPPTANTVFQGPTTFLQLGTFLAGISVTGPSSLGALSAAATTVGALTAGATNLGTLTATGLAQLQAGLLVSGASADLTSGANVTGPLAAGGTLDVVGRATFRGFAQLDRGSCIACRDPGGLPNGTVVIADTAAGPQVDISAATVPEAQRVIGVVGIHDPNPQTALVVTSGRVQARVRTGAAALSPGEWLTVSATDGVLIPGAPAGALVAKALEPLPANSPVALIWVLVALG